MESHWTQLAIKASEIQYHLQLRQSSAESCPARSEEGSAIQLFAERVAPLHALLEAAYRKAGRRTKKETF